jgi:hypothetical protein
MTRTEQSKSNRRTSTLADRVVESRDLHIKVDNSQVKPGAKRLRLEDFPSRPRVPSSR